MSKTIGYVLAIVVVLGFLAYGAFVHYTSEAGEGLEITAIVTGIVGVLGALGVGVQGLRDARRGASGKRRGDSRLPGVMASAAVLAAAVAVSGCTTGRAQQGQGETRTLNAILNIETLRKLVIESPRPGDAPAAAGASAPFSRLVGDVSAAAGDGGGEAAPGIWFTNTVQPTSTARDARADAEQTTDADAEVDASPVP